MRWSRCGRGRNENTGKDGVKVFEGQVFMTEEELAPFAVQEEEILLKVREKAAALIKNIVSVINI